MAKDDDKNTALPTSMNPNAFFIPLVFQAVFTGVVFAAIKFADAENMLAALFPVRSGSILAPSLQNPMEFCT